MAANDWSERTRMIVTAAVALVLNVGLGAGYYYIHGEWQKLEQTHKKKLAEKKTLEDFVKQGDERALELKTLTERFKAQESKLPDSEQIATLITDLAKIAMTSKAEMKNFSRGGGGGEDGSSYKRETWKTKWDGDFMGWCKVMNDIEEQFPRFIAFENLSIIPKNAGVIASGSVHDISVDLVTYRYIRPP